MEGSSGRGVVRFGGFGKTPHFWQALKGTRGLNCLPLARNQNLARFGAEQLLTPNFLQDIRITGPHKRDAALEMFARGLQRVELLLLGGELRPCGRKGHQPSLAPDGEITEIGDGRSTNRRHNQRTDNSSHASTHHHFATESQGQSPGKEKVQLRCLFCTQSCEDRSVDCGSVIRLRRSLVVIRSRGSLATSQTA
ncbi:MAG TPA: hypothetical protein VHW69_13830 [Rhizomicrobium sp.]|jgi:hypothetical protein|nr:hypothetical protein [Rhizomicrobium sp.]